MKKLFTLTILTLIAVSAFGQTDTVPATIQEYWLQYKWHILLGVVLGLETILDMTKLRDKLQASTIGKLILKALEWAAKYTGKKTVQLYKAVRGTGVKALIVAVLLTGLSLSASAQSKYRWYPFADKEQKVQVGADLPVYSKDSTFYFAPAVSFDIYTRGTVSNKHSVGAIPGIGYNFIYNPFLWEKNYLAGLGVFASAQQDTDDPDVFTFEITPVVSLLNWIKVGYGHQWNFGGTNEWVLRIGIVKSL